MLTSLKCRRYNFQYRVDFCKTTTARCLVLQYRLLAAVCSVGKLNVGICVARRLYPLHNSSPYSEIQRLRAIDKDSLFKIKGVSLGVI